MISRHFRYRMGFATLLPLLLVVLATAGAFWHWRVQDLEDAHRQRIRLVTHQFAIFCANGLFSGNTVSLQNVIAEIQREPDLLSVYVLDASGRVVASSTGAENAGYGVSAVAATSLLSSQEVDVLSEKIQSAVLPIDDLFSQGEHSQPAFLGTTVLKFSRAQLEDSKRQSLYVALLIGGLGMLLGGLLAIRLGNGVVRPIMRIYQMINRIGQGDFSVVENMAEEDPLRDLQNSLNIMARRLAWGREDMERRVDSVTHELRKKMELAQEATQAKSKFLASASHDLRQPAHALGMFVARQRQLPMDDQMRELVDQMEVSVQSMQDLLDSLLDLSRLDSGAVRVRMGAVQLDEVLQSVQTLVGTAAATKGLRLRVRRTGLWGQSDAFLLQRIIANLALNAVRYTAEGSVLIACRPDRAGESVRIEVWDSGQGIAPEHHEDVFKEFYQLPSQSGDRSFGMGLGLNIVQRSATLLGHSILLRSNTGCGSRFSVVLQAAAPVPASARQDPLLEVQTLVDFMGACVLVVDDNASAREAMQGLLQSWGCRVLVAASLAQALEQISEHGMPQVVLSDFHLGSGGDGLQTIAGIRTRWATAVPACVISGETNPDVLAQVQAAGLPLLHKPVRPAKLRSLLRRLIAGAAP